MLSATEVGREIFYPATHSAVLIAIFSFFALLQLVALAGLLGLFLLLVTLPALIRYLTLLLEARANGSDLGPPGIELFVLLDNAWSFFPVVHIAVVIFANYFVSKFYGAAAVILLNLILVFVIPASIIVLTLTHSPLESLNPRAIGRLLQRCESTYWIAPAYLLLTLLLLLGFAALGVPILALEFISFYAFFAAFALFGGIVRPFELQREVDIYPPREFSTTELDDRQLKHRTEVLNHAYGLVSRGNRAGGLQHIKVAIDADDSPAQATPWFLEQMFAWENATAALVFAQQYLSELLRNEDYVSAVKLIMRCRLIDDSFRPLPDDQSLALEAATRCHNDELISFLR